MAPGSAPPEPEVAAPTVEPGAPTPPAATAPPQQQQQQQPEPPQPVVAAAPEKPAASAQPSKETKQAMWNLPIRTYLDQTVVPVLRDAASLLYRTLAFVPTGVMRSSLREGAVKLRER